MKKIVAILLSLFSGASSAENLSEFSTSFGFDELEVMIKELTKTDSDLAQEISKTVESFKNTSEIDESSSYKLTSVPGTIELEREDDYTVVIYLFTPPEVSERIDQAFNNASEALGI